jgi:hypothetical protein
MAFSDEVAAIRVSYPVCRRDLQRVPKAREKRSTAEQDAQPSLGH